jgi:hypothetical protein
MIAELAVAVLAVGCTSIEHGKGSSTPPGSVQTARSTPHQPAPDLKAQLLTVADLPAGWSIGNSNGGDNTSAPSCVQRFDSELHTNVKADASFVKGSDFPVFAQSIGYFGSNATARSKFSAGAEIYNACTDVSFTSDGQKVTGSMAAMSFPKFGDQSQAWDMTFTVEGTTLVLDLVLMQKGAELEQVSYGDFGTPDLNELRTWAKSAADKMP